MNRLANGRCECADGYYMDATHGCLTCQYMIQGCQSCSIVNWNSGLPLDTVRKYGTLGGEEYLTCDSCSNDDRFVEINLNPAIAVAGFDYTAAITSSDLPSAVETLTPVKCESCYASFDGCSKCGTFGDSCTGCQLTHTLIESSTAGVYGCTRCDYFMSNCLTCYDQSTCRETKPRLLF